MKDRFKRAREMGGQLLFATIFLLLLIYVSTLGANGVIPM